MEVERWVKIVRYVRRGGECESEVGVGMTLEVRLHRFKKCENGGREAVKNTTVGSARSRVGN